MMKDSMTHGYSFLNRVVLWTCLVKHLHSTEEIRQLERRERIENLLQEIYPPIREGLARPFIIRVCSSALILLWVHY